MRIIMNNDSTFWWVHAHKPVHLHVLRALRLPEPRPIGVRPLNHRELLGMRRQLQAYKQRMGVI